MEISIFVFPDGLPQSVPHQEIRDNADTLKTGTFKQITYRRQPEIFQGYFFLFERKSSFLISFSNKMLPVNVMSSFQSLWLVCWVCNEPGAIPEWELHIGLRIYSKLNFQIFPAPSEWGKF